MRLPRLGSCLTAMLGLPGLLGLLGLLGCEGAQQGYYDACDEPAGLVLGCEPERQDEVLDAWDACEKLATCGVIQARGEDDNDDATPTVFDRCVDEIQEAMASQGELVLICIDEASCPDLSRTDPDTLDGADPNPGNNSIEGVIGYCGRLDP